MHNKFEALESLIPAIKDIYSDIDNDGPIKLTDKHFILYNGNPNSKLMIVKFSPSSEEIFWAKRNKEHVGYLFENNRYYFKNKLGIDIREDSFCCALCPFHVTSSDFFAEHIIPQIMWIFDGYIDIIKPKVVLATSFRVLHSILLYKYHTELDRSDFDEDLLHGNSFYTVEDDITYAGIELQSSKTGTLKVLKKLKILYSNMLHTSIQGELK